MRVKKFDQQEQAALRALGFDIDDDGEVANITGDMTVSAIRPSGDDRFLFQIELPNGMELTAWGSRDMLLDAPGIDEE